MPSQKYRGRNEEKSISMITHNHKKRIWAVTGSVVASIVLWIAGYRYITGYFPIPEIIRRISYINSLETNSVDIKFIWIDKQFRLHEKGYTAVAKIQDAEPLMYCLQVGFAHSLPLDYEFKTQLLLEVEKDGKVLYSQILKGTERPYVDIGQEDRRPTAIHGYCIHTLPFYIAHKKYRNSFVKITVIEADSNITSYVDSAIVTLGPVLEL